MPEISIEVTNTGVKVAMGESLVVRETEYERTADSAKACVRFDTRVVPEIEDHFIDETGVFPVIDDNVAPGDDNVVARFNTLAEAEACIVGLEYLDLPDVKSGRFRIITHVPRD